jgi:hypothetical protein
MVWVFVLSAYAASAFLGARSLGKSGEAIRLWGRAVARVS